MGRRQETALEARIAGLEAKLASAERGYALQIEAMAASHEATIERERAEFEERPARGLSDMESRHSRQMAALEAEHAIRWRPSRPNTAAKHAGGSATMRVVWLVRLRSCSHWVMANPDIEANAGLAD